MTQFNPSANAQVLLQGLSLGNQVRQQREALRQRQSEFNRSIALDEIRLGLAQQADARAAESHLWRKENEAFQSEQRQWQREDRKFGMEQRDGAQQFAQSYAASPPELSTLSLYPREMIDKMTPEQILVAAGEDLAVAGRVSNTIRMEVAQVEAKRLSMMHQMDSYDQAVQMGILTSAQAEQAKQHLMLGAAGLDKQEQVLRMRAGVDAILEKPGANQQIAQFLKAMARNELERDGTIKPGTFAAILDLVDVQNTTGLEQRVGQWEVMEPILREAGMREADLATTRARVVSDQPVPYRGSDDRAKIPESVDELDAKQRYEAAAKRLTGLEDKLSDDMAERGDAGKTKTLEDQINRVRQNVAVLRQQWDNLRRQRVGNPPDEPGVVAPRDDAPIDVQGIGQITRESVAALVDQWEAENPKKPRERDTDRAARRRKWIESQLKGAK